MLKAAYALYQKVAVTMLNVEEFPTWASQFVPIGYHKKQLESKHKYLANLGIIHMLWIIFISLDGINFYCYLNIWHTFEFVEFRYCNFILFYAKNQLKMIIQKYFSIYFIQIGIIADQL